MRAQVVVCNDDRLLLARHQRQDISYWVLPGGEIEAGETPEQAAVREVQEETGLSISIERLLFIDPPRQTGNIVIRRPRYTFLGRIVAGELRNVADPESADRQHGRLDGVSWMPFDTEEYDEATRDTLRLVREALQLG